MNGNTNGSGAVLRKWRHWKGQEQDNKYPATWRRKASNYPASACRVVCLAAESGVPAPGLMVSLGYLDAYRSAWLPANLIQAQRDYFGAHTYERIDAKGTFHTEWGKD
jgi:6-phosphogluconate dehydrogenase